MRGENSRTGISRVAQLAAKPNKTKKKGSPQRSIHRKFSVGKCEKVESRPVRKLPIQSPALSFEMEQKLRPVEKIIVHIQIAGSVQKEDHSGSWLSRLPLTEETKFAGTSSWPSWISHFTGSLVGHSPSEMLCPPADWKKVEVLHLFRCSTHTTKRGHKLRSRQ